MKKRNSFVILCATSFCFALAISGCGSKSSASNSSGTDETTYWTVTFDSQGGSDVDSQQVKNGELAAEPTAPTKDNYTFDGWFEEKDAVTEFDFETPITTNWTLYAGWTKSNSGGGGGGGNTDPDPEEEYDYYFCLGGTDYGMTYQGTGDGDTQTGEWQVSLGNVTAGQSVSIKDGDKVALSENFGAEPGDNNVAGEVGSYTINNDATGAIAIVKTWESGWTNFYVSGYSSDGEESESSYYLELNGTKTALTLNSDATLAENQTAEYFGTFNVTSGDTVKFYVDDTQITNIGANNGNDAENNASGSEGVFTIRTTAENAGIYLQIWNDGYSFWITGYSAEGEEEETTYYFDLNGTQTAMTLNSDATLAENQVAEYQLTCDVTANDTVKFYADSDLITNIGANNGNTADNNATGSDGVFTIRTTAENAGIYLQIWNDGYSFWITGYSAEEENYVTIYFRDASWWNSYAASTNYVAWSGDSQPSGIGSMMTHIEYDSTNGYNYWSCQVLDTMTSIVFIRTGDSGATDWGARTVTVSLSDRGTYNMYDISFTSAGWVSDGNYITGAWTTYSA